MQTILFLQGVREHHIIGTDLGKAFRARGRQSGNSRVGGCQSGARVTRPTEVCGGVPRSVWNPDPVRPRRCPGRTNMINTQACFSQQKQRDTRLLNRMPARSATALPAPWSSTPSRRGSVRPACAVCACGRWKKRTRTAREVGECGGGRPLTQVHDRGQGHQSLNQDPEA